MRLEISAFVYLPACLLTLLMLTPPVPSIFAAWGQRWLYIAATAFGLSFSLTPLAGFLARRLRILDRPDARKLHAQATPLLGGAAVFAGFITSLLANAILAPELLALLSAAMVLFVTGVFDDWREVPAGLKLLIQLVCTAMVMLAGIVLRVLPAEWGVWGLIGNLLLTGLWIIGITNAMNFFDGMDGLAAGLGAIIAFFLGMVAFQTDQPFLGWISLAVLGSCLGFLPYNFRPGGSAVIQNLDLTMALRQHDRWLRTVVYSRVGGSEGVDDVMQEVALAAVRHAAGDLGGRGIPSRAGGAVAAGFPHVAQRAQPVQLPGVPIRILGEAEFAVERSPDVAQLSGAHRR